MHYTYKRVITDSFKVSYDILNDIKPNKINRFKHNITKSTILLLEKTTLFIAESSSSRHKSRCINYQIIEPLA